MFLEEQGYPLEENILFQDNQSAMKLELNRRMSSSRKTKHMNNRTFWIKDRVKSDNIKIMYCPTGIMVSDFFTKALQGMLFKRLRAVIMGHQPIEWLEQFRDEKSPSKERVRRHETDEKSKESKTAKLGGIDDVIIGSKTKGKETLSWAEVVRRSSYDQRRSVNSPAIHRFERIVEDHNS